MKSVSLIYISLQMFQSCILLQVLRHLTQAFNTEVFQVLDERPSTQTRGVMAALHLPQDMLARWVLSTGSVLDLRCTTAYVAQCTRLLTVLQQGQSTVTELHIQVPETSSIPFDAAHIGNAVDTSLSKKYSAAVATSHSCSTCRQHMGFGCQTNLQAKLLLQWRGHVHDVASK